MQFALRKWGASMKVETISASFHSFPCTGSCAVKRCLSVLENMQKPNKQTNTQTMFRLLLYVLLLLLQVNNWHNGKCQRHSTTRRVLQATPNFSAATLQSSPCSLQINTKMSAHMRFAFKVTPSPLCVIPTPLNFFSSWNILHICLAGQQKPQPLAVRWGENKEERQRVCASERVPDSAVNE